MADFLTTHPHLHGEYPYSYFCDPPLRCTLLSEEDIITEFEKYGPDTPQEVAGCDFSLISFQPSTSETYVS